MPNLKVPYDHRLNKPFMVEIIEVKQERDDVVTLSFIYNPINEPVKIYPGQFVMVWVPGNDEIPMSISHIYEDKKISISIADVGETTHILNIMKVGDKIGIRGPYGTHFDLNLGKDQIAIIVAGGIGAAAVLPLVYNAFSSLKNHELKDVVFLEGVKTEKELLYHEEIKNLCESSLVDGLEDQSQFCTDDGTFGFEGFPTQKLEEYLKDNLGNNFNSEQVTVYACGPEIMLKAIFEICEKFNIACQLSLERMMRCGFGLCGLCALEPSGLLVCHDGPVFLNKDLRKCTDFGKKHRDFSGREIDL